MKKALLMMAAVMVAECGAAWAAAKAGAEKVVVCLENGNRDGVEDAKTRAASLLLPAGVRLEWHGEVGFCQGQPDAIVTSFRTSTPREFFPGALAYALSYEGVHIQVFYDRIAEVEPALRPALMAHVIVHEITHILQGLGRHSTSGIMKAHWTSYDYFLMKRGQLRFTRADVELIHSGLAARARRPAPAINGANRLVTNAAR